MGDHDLLGACRALTRGRSPISPSGRRVAPSALGPNGGLLAESSAVGLHKVGFCDAVHVGGGVLAWARQADPSLPTY